MKRKNITLTNRHRDEIFELILEACQSQSALGGAGKTTLMYRGQLSWYQLPKYLERLLACGAIENGNHLDNSKRYYITLKGRALLHRIRELLAMLEMPRANYSKRHNNYKGWNQNTPGPQYQEIS
jgi:predicted transcriptional regulator